MMLNTKEWKAFYLTDIFPNIQRGKRLTKSKQTDGKMPYVSSTSLNNGVDNFISNKNNVRVFSNCLSIANSGSVGASFYEPFIFVASDHITHLKNDKMNKHIYLFIATMTNRLSDKYNFNREINDYRISRETIMLPINDKEEPDWQLMEQLMVELEERKRVKYSVYLDNILNGIEYKEIDELKNKGWKDFYMTEVCDIESGHDIYESERKIGNIPYITSTSNNNGIKYFVSNINTTLESNAISVNRNGSVGYCFYHKYFALYSNDCRKLILKSHRNEYVSLFITNQITMQKDKYNYGYKMGTNRLKKQKIMLPINKNNEPDFEYMEQYIKNLMIIKYNQFKNYAYKKAIYKN